MFGWILLSLSAVIFIVLSTPEISHALEIQPVYKMLAGTTGGSKQIKDVWGQILNFVNAIAIVMLIFIAFANILRININTYGIKKFLPSLALAIIAANFSYLFCRILVDLANVACDLLLHGTLGGDTKITGAFDFTGDAYKVTFAQLLKPFIFTVLEFVGSVAMLILAFMFFIRMYVIYFLVALSPITIVCMVLPLTKSVFNMWWQQFWKWTFMPVVSLFWLWVGSLWLGGSLAPKSSVIFGFGFAIVCYYLAITTPQKMGQGVMTSWNNLGKWGWGKTGGAAWKATGGKAIEYGKAKSAATWGARWQNVQNLVKDRTGLGKGLDMAKQKQADAEKRKGLIQDEAKAGYIKRRGDQRALWEVENMKKEGSAAYAEKKALAEAFQRPDSEIAKRIRAMREKSQEAMLQMSVYDANWTELNNDMKTNFLTQKDSEGNDVTEGSEEFERRDDFYKKYAHGLFQAQISQEESNKAAGDPIRKLAAERMSIDNIVGEKEQIDKIAESLGRLVEFERRGLLLSEEAKNDRETLERAGYRSDSHEELEDSKTVIDDRAASANASYSGKVGQLREKGVPLGLQDMVKSQNGEIALSKLPGSDLERSRTGQYMSGVIREGAKGMSDKYSSRELAHFIQYGAQAEEGLNDQVFKNFLSGKLGENKADENRKVAEIVRAAAKKMTAGRPSNPENMAIITGAVRGLEGAQNTHGLGQMIQTMNDHYRSKDMVDQVINFSGMDHKQMASAILERTHMSQRSNDHLGTVVYAVKNNADVGFGGSESKHV